MGGVGNFMTNSRTLYIGNIRVGREKDNLEKRMRENFGEYGELEYVKVFPNRAIGFITYKLRSSAEFAKIAMADHNAGGGAAEVLNVRWAMEDPNPKAIEHKKRKNIDFVEGHMAKRGYTGNGGADASFEYPSEYKLPDTALGAGAASAGVGGGEVGGDGDYWTAYYERQAMAVDASLSYPDTDLQFEAALDKADQSAVAEAYAGAVTAQPGAEGEAGAGPAAGERPAPEGGAPAASGGDAMSAELQAQWAAYYQQQQWAAYYQQQAWTTQQQYQQQQAAAAQPPAEPTAWPTAPKASAVGEWPKAPSRDTATGATAAAEAAPQRSIGVRGPPSIRQ